MHLSASIRTIMEFAYDHVLIESSSPAEESGVHMAPAAACAENDETRRYTQIVDNAVDSSYGR